VDKEASELVLDLIAPAPLGNTTNKARGGKKGKSKGKGEDAAPKKLEDEIWDHHE